MLHYLAIFAAGMAAGTINTIVGSGSLITFPVLLALGYPPVTANISNSLGLVPGGLSGSWGYRRELSTQKRALKILLPCSLAGGISGALLLLVLPAAAFTAIVPVLVALAVLLVAFQPLIQRTVAKRRAAAAEATARDSSVPTDEKAAEVGAGPSIQKYGLGVAAACFFCGVYGGYFGAAQGVLLVGLFGVLLTDPLQTQNALKNILVTCVNLIAAIVFVVIAIDRLDWIVVAIIGVGSLLGGFLGARIGRRLPTIALRIVIIAVGTIAFVRLTS
ncbi:MAG TPA: sulfite exporter TauE/SafE family protein [Actinopolymorphaceae bacterium]